MNRNRRRIATLCLLASFAVSGTLFAWGEDGHRIVGEIAWQLMTPEARAGARVFLPDGRYDRLYEAAVWADDYARQYRRYDWLKPFHYVNSEPDDTEIDAPADCECVVGAIPRFARQIVDESRGYWLRVNGLRLLAHFVGDIHQPLHVGHPDGRGGNRTTVTFDGQERRLHSVWDTGLIRFHFARMAEALAEDDDEFEPDMLVATAAPEEFDWEDYARELLGQIEQEDVDAWTADLEPGHWATESLGFGRALAYDVEDGAELGADYYARAIPVVSERLKMAGARLAAMLNDIFADD